MVKLALRMALVSSALIAAPLQASITYQIAIDKDDPTQALIEVDTSELEATLWSPARELAAQPPLPLVCHTGDETNLLPYQVKQTCEKVSWSLHFEPAPEHGIDASEQQNSYSAKKGWHLLTEWHSLPRLETDAAIQVCFAEDHCRPLPSETQAPLFMLANLPMQQVTLFKRALPVYTDVDDLLKNKQTWQPVMEEQMAYLLGVFSAYRAMPWELAVFGREQSAGSLGGASGEQVFITNIPLENGVLAQNALPHFLRISAHESIHFFSNIDEPIWLNESLAEYYAQKSLFDTEYAHIDPLQAWRNAAKKLPVADTGLYLASKKVSEQQLMQYYPLFYLKGAAFWLELDMQLQREARSLDQYIALLQQGDSQDEKLPNAFVEAVSEVIGGGVFKQLEGKYLLSVKS